MAGKEGKELLGKNTDRALADGAFGLPWFVATDREGKTETFWGVDHLGAFCFDSNKTTVCCT
jgi:2-hydroxychromene-2-carboxylate isomerase